MKIRVNMAGAVSTISAMCAGVVAIVVAIIFRAEFSLTEMLLICILCGAAVLGLFIAFGAFLFQWVTLDENGITARSLFRVIKHADWKDVTEIKGIWISYSLLSQGKKFLLFVDGAGSRGLPPTIYNRKDKYIRVAESTKCLEYLSKFHPEIKITEDTGFC